MQGDANDSLTGMPTGISRETSVSSAVVSIIALGIEGLISLLVITPGAGCRS